MNKTVVVGAGLVIIAGSAVAGLPLYTGMQAERELRGLEELRAGDLLIRHEITDYNRRHLSATARGQGVIQVGLEEIPFEVVHRVRHGITDMHVDSEFTPTGEYGDTIQRLFRNEPALTVATTIGVIGKTMALTVPPARGHIDPDNALSLDFGGMTGTIDFDAQQANATFNAAPLSLTSDDGTGVHIGPQKLMFNMSDIADRFGPAESAYTIDNVLISSLSDNGPSELRLDEIAILGEQGVSDGMLWVESDIDFAGIGVNDYQSDRLHIRFNADNLEQKRSRDLAEEIEAVNQRGLDRKQTNQAMTDAFINALPDLLAHSPALGVQLRLGEGDAETLSILFQTRFAGNSTGEPVQLGLQNFAQVVIDLQMMIQESLLSDLQEALGADTVNAQNGIVSLQSLAQQGMARQIPGGYETEIRLADARLMINGNDRSDILSLLFMGAAQNLF